MNKLIGKIVGITLRIVFAGLCGFAIWSSWKIERADMLFRRDTADSIRSAIQLEPDAWPYYLRLSQLDEGNARPFLEDAVRLNPYNGPVYIELGLRYEADGDYNTAEKDFLQAYAVDHTFIPRWSLANFYFRRDNVPEFWKWARAAAEMPSDEMSPLFELCWHVKTDPEEIGREILNYDPDLLRQYVDFLISKNQLPATFPVAQRLVRYGNPATDRSYLFTLIDRLLAANRGAEAQTIWQLLISQKWVSAESAPVNNPHFDRMPLPVAVDWFIPSYAGIYSLPGPSGLTVEFNGNQPQDCTIAEQAVALTPGEYDAEYSYQTSGIAPGTGLKWEVLDVLSNEALAESGDLSSEALHRANFTFSVPPDTSVVRLRLHYVRAVGTTRISGRLVISSIQISKKLTP